ncbi:hypothetical protein [Levilactobacillus sp. HBUAS70063]|uniref:hypothetical protein n=1 Tax=Levilactobacillus sp. HBUAS70063 TaxID=3109359 RepID=UPI003132AB71
MNNNFLNLSQFLPLQEGHYDGCMLKGIEQRYSLENPQQLDYLILRFVIDGREIEDRLFGKGDVRLIDFSKSLMKYAQSDGNSNYAINLDDWVDVTCSLDYENYMRNDRVYPRTRNWSWNPGSTSDDSRGLQGGLSQYPTSSDNEFSDFN